VAESKNLEFPRIQAQEYTGFIQKNRHDPKQVSKVLAWLGDIKPFIEAFESEIGNEIFQDAIQNMDIIHAKMMHQEETPEERAEFHALQRIVRRWHDKFNAYAKMVKTVKENK
jgi:hypothetical protein